MDTTVKIKIIGYPDYYPIKSTSKSNAFDIKARIKGCSVIDPNNGRIVIPNGFSLDLPDGVYAYILPRSGMAIKYGITVLNAPGLIDTDYKGEVKTILINTDSKPYVVNNLDRIAQIQFKPDNLNYEFVNEYDEPINLVSDNVRNGGFGSTGE